VSALESGLGEQDAVVGHNPHWVAMQLGKPTHESGAVQLLELVKVTAVHDARDHLADVEPNARVSRYHAVQLRWREERFGDFL
jgi:hypothetical protein